MRIIRHPQRLKEEICNGEVDRFPHRVICTVLRGLTAGGRYLWNKYDNSDDLLVKQTDLAAPDFRAFRRKTIALGLPLLYNPLLNNLVSILSRVAEGQGPAKPQQPVSPHPIPSPRGRGANKETLVLTPTRSGRER
jgi:hypothetical protein